jgi:tetratricopeptide (TPR) repeat protein
MASIATLKKDLEQAREQEDRVCELRTLLILGESYREKGHRKLAISAWKEAIPLLMRSDQHREASDVYRRLAKLCEEMNHRQKATRSYLDAISCLQHVRDITAPDLGTIAHCYTIAAELEGHSGYLDTAHRYFVFARETYRMLDELEREALCWLAEAMMWFDRSVYDKGLGYAHYGLEQLRRVTPPSPNLAEAEQRFQTLREWLLNHSNEQIFQQFVQESATIFASAAAEAEEERKKREAWRRDLAPDASRLGLVRHEQGRRKCIASDAVQLIHTHGLSQSVLSVYKEARWQFRSQHNRLGEALIEGTIWLIEQISRASFSCEVSDLLSLYRDADNDVLGQLRVLYNYGVICSCKSYKDFEEAVAYLHCVLLGLQQDADLREKRWEARIEKHLSTWKKHLSPQSYQQALAEGTKLFLTHLTSSHPVRISCSPLRENRPFWEQEEEGHIVEVPHFLAATGSVLEAVIEEATRSTPRRFEWEAKRAGEYRTLWAMTTGHRLAGEITPSTLIGMRFLLWHLSTDPEQDSSFQPLDHPVDDARPGVHHFPSATLLTVALDYLDHPMPEELEWLDGRAVELLNEQEQIIGCISWDHHCQSRLSPDMVSNESIGTQMNDLSV